MNFIPDEPAHPTDVPFFDDVIGKDGWQGHTTKKSLDKLKAEVAESMTRLGGIVTAIQMGKFSVGDRQRDGLRINYLIERPDGSMAPGRLDIAALPVKTDWGTRRTLEKRRNQSTKMALYMLRNALDGTWFLQQLSPGYAPLMPFMIEQSSGKTISQIWTDSAFRNLLPPGDSDFVEGEFSEV